MSLLSDQNVVNILLIRLNFQLVLIKYYIYIVFMLYSQIIQATFIHHLYKNYINRYKLFQCSTKQLLLFQKVQIMYKYYINGIYFIFQLVVTVSNDVIELIVYNRNVFPLTYQVRIYSMGPESDLFVTESLIRWWLNKQLVEKVGKSMFIYK